MDVKLVAAYQAAAGQLFCENTGCIIANEKLLGWSSSMIIYSLNKLTSSKYKKNIF